MLTHRVVLALNDLLHNADQGIANTSFVLAKKGRNVRGGGRGLICSTTNPLMASIFLALKDGFDELGDEMANKDNQELTQQELVAKMREKLSMCLSLLEVEQTQH